MITSKMKSWLKGGLIGLIVGVLDILALGAFQAPVCEIGAQCPEQHILGRVASLLVYPVLTLNLGAFSLVLILAYSFIIGAIIGWIVKRSKK